MDCSLVRTLVHRYVSPGAAASPSSSEGRRLLLPGEPLAPLPLRRVWRAVLALHLVESTAVLRRGALCHRPTPVGALAALLVQGSHVSVMWHLGVPPVGVSVPISIVSEAAPPGVAFLPSQLASAYLVQVLPSARSCA
ncbi:hypothetical protein J1605_009370 [Eschrichtius robustus]|uniref:Uncharacterized protein n=1 Tax=Eschrichtius robustus TaxID=9764 RepID=A0AB34GRZ6_ESCRO|nr:hypothetical protein J1605_009370 [Eschrichtius robustus]